MDKLRLMQTQETDLYARLQDPALSAEARATVVAEMNELSAFRVELYQTIRRMFDNAKQGESRADHALSAQIAAAQIIESRLDETKRRANASAALQGQKLRLVQINTYHSKWYQSYTRILRIIVFMCLPILIVYKVRGIVGEMVVNVVLVVVLFFGGLALFHTIVDYTTRNSMNFDQYNWSFDADSAPNAADSRNAEASGDEWNWDNGGKPYTPPTCVGAACCASDMAFDDNTNQCIAR